MSIISDSLSLGMKEALKTNIFQGEPFDVTFVTSCRITNQEELEQVIDSYSQTYWDKFPEEASRLTRKAWEAGKIICPWVQGRPSPIANRSTFLYPTFEDWTFELAKQADDDPPWSMGWCPRDCKVTKEEILACNATAAENLEAAIWEVCELFFAPPRGPMRERVWKGAAAK